MLINRRVNTTVGKLFFDDKGSRFKIIIIIRVIGLVRCGCVRISGTEASTTARI